MNATEILNTIKKLVSDSKFEIILEATDHILNCNNIQIGLPGYFNNIVILTHDEEWEKCYDDTDRYFSNEQCSITLNLASMSDDYAKADPIELKNLFDKIVKKL